MSEDVHLTRDREPPRLLLLTLGLTALAWFIAIVAMLGTRWGLWGFPRGVGMLRTSVWLSVITGVLAGWVIYQIRGRGLAWQGPPLALLALLASLILVIVPLRVSRNGANTPLIHDITTDIQNPPAFEAVLERRGSDSNAATYGGVDVARLQNEAYPDIRPVIIDLSVNAAFQRAREVAERSGWRIVQADEATGRIEATDRTFWFGLPEDVVIRLTPLEERTVVDVRSASRIGEGDRGSNARRVREYLQALRS
ncbi:MAG: DUF1499 domain-containing protein [Gemmatimonadota bacterium]|jgi:uncharacterized protein (DUF1499 family)|nr:DUF1499 domain-containing protein [Gemmatimonadota bacterium]